MLRTGAEGTPGDTAKYNTPSEPSCKVVSDVRLRQIVIAITMMHACSPRLPPQTRTGKLTYVSAFPEKVVIFQGPDKQLAATDR